jgi:hypothetical protein
MTGVRWVPDRPTGTGALVLAGSSGRVDSDRANLLAAHGVLAESVQWFGGPGQSEYPFEIPLEPLLSRIAALADECDSVLVVGTSFGSEAALLTGVHSPSVTGVVAFAPSDVVWAGVNADGRVSSHWTLDGQPLPYVPFDDTWQPDAEPPAFAGLYRASRRRYPDDVAAATIPVESIRSVVLVAGGDDLVWPSITHAEAIAARRAAHGLATTVVTDAEAGHRTILPGEVPVSGGMRMRRGGTEIADRRLGSQAWPHLSALF